MLKLYILLAAYQTACCATLSPTKRIAQSTLSRSAPLFGTMTHGVKKENLPSKMCVTCNRPFTWRKKWERCWDEVSTCSKGCNAKRRALAKTNGHPVSDDEEDEEDVAVKTASTKQKFPLKVDMIVKKHAARVQPVETHLDGDDSDDNEDDEVEAKDSLKSGKKLSRKKLQKLKMMQISAEISTEENCSTVVADREDISDDDDEENDDDADEEEEKTGNDQKLSKKLQRLNIKQFPVENSTLNVNSTLKADTDDEDNDGAVEDEMTDANEPVKSEKKLSRKKLQKLKWLRLK